MDNKRQPSKELRLNIFISVLQFLSQITSSHQTLIFLMGRLPLKWSKLFEVVNVAFHCSLWVNMIRLMKPRNSFETTCHKPSQANPRQSVQKNLCPRLKTDKIMCWNITVTNSLPGYQFSSFCYLPFHIYANVSVVSVNLQK